MAHVKAGATAKGNKDSAGKRLGVKVFGGQKAKPGNIIIRQKGTKIRSGSGTMMGRDFTIFATEAGVVQFSSRSGKDMVSVVPAA